MALVDQIIGAESGGNPNATNPNSSAAGPGQFINSTWLDVARKIRPELSDRPDSEVLALKTDPELARQATDYYAQQNQAILAKNGLPVTPGSTYLAHFAGPQGAVKILQADPNAPVESILGASVVKANPFLAGMTAQGLQAWAARKMGVASPLSEAPPASPASPPAPLVTPQAPPVFAPQAPQQPSQQPSQSDAPLQFTPPQMAPIFYAQRRPVDLSKLRAAFNAPTFAKG